MPSKLVENKKNYILCSYIGNKSGIIGAIKSRYWTWRVNSMSEGEIIKRYYSLTDKTEVMELWLKD